jgi:hypothetical protein
LTGIADVPGFCERAVNECGIASFTVDDCIATYEIALFTESCANRFGTATCDDIGEIEATCFPACSPNPGTCNSDGTVTTCSTGRSYTFSCDGVCNSNGQSWTGTCGVTSPTGETAETVKCWCE